MPSSSPTRAGLHSRDALYFAALVVAYYATARVGLGLGAVGGVAGAVWPPSGIALSALLIWGTRLWPAIALAAFAVNFSIGVPVAAAAAIATGNTLEALLAATCLRRFAPLTARNWGSAREVLALVTLAALGSSLVSATIGSTAAHLGGTIPSASWSLAWRSWWTGDALGILLVTPVFLTWPTLVRESWPLARLLEALATLTLLVLVSALVFRSTPTGQQDPRAYYVLPPLLWAAVRFRQPGAALSVPLMAVLAIWGTSTGHGPFALESRYYSLLALQTFIGITSVTALSFAAVSAERLEASHALARENAFATAILEAAGLLVVLEPNGLIVRCNRACQRLLGGEPRQGQPFARAFALSENADEVQHALSEIVRTRMPATFESRCRSELGERVIVWSAAPLLHRSGDVEHVIASGNDLTDHRRLEAQLVAADRLAAMGRLAAGVGHEINNPLAYIMMSLELGLRITHRNRERGPRDWREIDRLLATALEGSERVRRIVGDLKTLTRVSEGSSEPVDIHRALDSCIPMAATEIRHRARLVKDYHSVPMVDADEGRLGQVFLNLLTNAAQAIPEGHAPRHEVRVRTDTDGEGRVVVEVSDTGAGVDPQLLPRLFEPFFTTKPTGVGLGLSVSHAIVTSFNGTLSVQSELGHGTTCRVTLPASSASEARAALPLTPHAVGAGPTLRILVVDDECELARALAQLLAEHEVQLAASGKQALELCLSEEYDLVLCDLLMPELTGMDVYEELVRKRPGYEQRFVFMTGGAFTQRAREFLDVVSNERLEKPFSSDVLLAVVAERARHKPLTISGVAPRAGRKLQA